MKKIDLREHKEGIVAGDGMLRGISRGIPIATDRISEETKKIWSKYWIEGGLNVVHRNHITSMNKDRIGLFKMIVDKVLKRSIEGTGGIRKVHIEGVKCHWLDETMHYNIGVFHTNELVPFVIAEKGLDEVDRWIKRPEVVLKEESRK
jgi:uncharacterized protein YodC (DUF2158 family)